MNILHRVCPTTGVCSTTLLSMFNYPRESVQLPLGVCSTTLGSMFNYPRECVQLPWGGIFKYLRIVGNLIKSKCFARCYLKQVRKTSCRRGFRTMFFFTFSGTPHAKHLLSRRCLDGRGPKLVSKVSDSYDAVQQKSKKT